MKRRGIRIFVRIAWLVAAAALAVAPPSAAANDVIAVQPDGKILVAGGAVPGFGMLARLDPDGSLDTSFGQGGFVVDPGSPPFVALVVLTDGRIVVLDESIRLRRFEADGSADLHFGESGVSVPPLDQGYLENPAVLALLPDGRLAVGGNYRPKIPPTALAIAYVFAADGRSVERVGEVPPPGSPDFHPGGFPGWITALASRGDGTLLMAARSPLSSGIGSRTVLARLQPGTDHPYDPAFGGGSGLVTVPHPAAIPTLNALEPLSGGALAAGAAGGHLTIARFSPDGILEDTFGVAGFASVLPGVGRSWGNDLVVEGDRKILVAAEARRRKAHGRCRCEEPLLVRFLPDGAVDEGFAGDGVVRLVEPGGGPIRTTASTVVSLHDGRALIAGRLVARSKLGLAVVRVRDDGRLDSSFGQRGIATVDACPGSPAAQRRRGCLPSLRARMHIIRHRGRPPALHLDVGANLGWARVTGVSLVLPRQLRIAEDDARLIRATLVEVDGRRRSTPVAVHGRELSGHWSVSPKSVSLIVPARALRIGGRGRATARVPFRVKARFGTGLFVHPSAGWDEAVLRRALG